MIAGVEKSAGLPRNLLTDTGDTALVDPYLLPMCSGRGPIPIMRPMNRRRAGT